MACSVNVAAVAAHDWHPWIVGAAAQSELRKIGYQRIRYLGCCKGYESGRMVCAEVEIPKISEGRCAALLITKGARAKLQEEDCRRGNRYQATKCR